MPNGNLVKNSEDEVAFVPKLLPPQITYDTDMISLLAKAGEKVGELRGVSQFVSNPSTFIKRYIRNEAVLSSKIEGTIATIKDILQYEITEYISERDAERLRLREVQNYILALESSLDVIREGKQITLDTIKIVHKDLMEGVRGHNMRPGEFRRVQNYIVAYGKSPKNSTYTPPPPEYLDELLKNFEKFIQTTPNDMSVLIQCAIMHYQFEAIHPFQDGNGRVGRILVALLLSEKEILPQPILYMSAYFERNVKEYYSRLLAVSQKSDLNEWIKFFLVGIIDQTTSTIQDICELINLQNRYKKQLGHARTGANSLLLLDHLIENPFVTIPHVCDMLSITYPAAKNIVYRLVQLEILEESPIKYQSKVFVARKILDILINSQ